MKTMSMKRILFIMFCMILSLTVCSVQAKAGKVTRISTYLNNNKTLHRDITGDGKADAIRFKFTKDEYGSILKMQIYVNGKKAAAYTYDAYYSYGMTVNYVYLSKSRVFLQIYGNGDNDYIVNNALYSYKSGKLKKVLDLSKYRMQAGDVVSASKSQIKVAYTGQPMETGRLYCELGYTYKSGRFKLKSNTTSVHSTLGSSWDHDEYEMYFINNQFVVANKRTFYTSSSMKKKAFTAYRGDVLTLKKIKVTSNKVYLQFKKGNKTGWQRVFRNNVYDFAWDNWQDSGWFYGVANRLAG